MSQGYFEKGRWIEAEEKIQTPPNEYIIQDAIREMKEATREYREMRDRTALEYYRYMPFLTRLKYLIFPDRYRK